MSAEAGSGRFDHLRQRVADEADPTRRVEQMLLELADIVKATSNDQNVQRLAREMRASAPGLAAQALA